MAVVGWSEGWQQCLSAVGQPFPPTPACALFAQCSGGNIPLEGALPLFRWVMSGLLCWGLVHSAVG